MKNLIRFDWALKKILRSKVNFAVLEGLLTVLLKEKITILKILESESNKASEDDKFNRVDIMVENSAGEILIIEVQAEDQLDYLQRLLYGTSKVVVEYIKAGEAYKNIKKVISISLLYFSLGQGKDYVYHGTTQLRGIHYDDILDLSEKQQIAFGKKQAYELFPEYYILKINDFNDIAKEPLDEWLYFLKNEEIKDSFTAPGLKEARETLSVMKMPEPERKKYDHYLDSLHDRASFYESTYVDGHRKGLAEGEEKGKAEGIAEEKARSEAKLAEEMARLKQQLIAKGLSEAEVNNLLQ